MSSSTAPQPDLIEQFEQLSHPLRFHILSVLNHSNPRKRRELIPEAVAGSGEDVERLTVETYHNHLPKLREAGFIDWDRESDTVTRGPRFDELSPLLGFIENYGNGRPEGQF